MGVNAPTRLARQTLYTSPWVNLHVDRVEFPGDRIIERHHFLEFPSKSVGVLVENDASQLLLVEAYRYVTGTVEWEIPAGHIDDGETVLAAAEREVNEEGGYATAGHRLIYSFYPIPGIGDALHHVVYCQAVGQGADFDRSEVRAVRWFSRSELQTLLDAKTLHDGYTVTALLLWLGGMTS